MPDLDENLLVIVQRAKEDEIQKRVYAQIKQDITHLKFLGVFGAILVLLLMAFHSQIFTFMVTNFGEGLRTKIIDDVKIHTAALQTAQDKVQAVSDAMVAQAHSYLDDLVKRQGEVAHTRDDLRNQIEQIEEEMKKIELAKERITQAQSDAQVAINQLKIYEPLIKILSSNQNAIIAALNTSKDFQLDKEKVRTITETSPQPIAVERKGTVYFQFAGFTRSVAKQISDKIQDAGWTIPGEERTPAAINTNEVRYNRQDKTTADLLTSDANAALRALNIPITLVAKQNDNIKPGIPEIWVYQR